MILKSLFRGKKGFLLASETLKIVIAVICIAFLIYFLTALYFSKVNGEKKVQAENLVEVIKPILNNVSGSEGDSLGSIDVFNPKGWYFFSFVGSEIKPNLCAGRNCLCICDNAWDIQKKFNRQQKECDKNGVCFIEDNLGEFERIEITGDLKIINIIKSGGVISLRE